MWILINELAISGFSHVSVKQSMLRFVSKKSNLICSNLLNKLRMFKWEIFNLFELFANAHLRTRCGIEITLWFPASPRFRFNYRTPQKGVYEWRNLLLNKGWLAKSNLKKKVKQKQSNERYLCNNWKGIYLMSKFV